MAEIVRTGEWNENIDPRFVRIREPRGISTTFIVIAVVTTAILFALLVLAMNSGFMVLFFFAPQLLISILQAKEQRLLKESIDDLKRQLDVPEGTHVFPAMVRIVRQGEVLGEDLGCFALIDGWLVYTGLRTMFSVSAEEIEQAGEGDGGFVGLSFKHRFFLRFGKWKDSTVVGIKPLEDPASEGSFKNSLGNFLRTYQSVDGIAVAPPNYPTQRAFEQAKWRLTLIDRATSPFVQIVVGTMLVALSFPVFRDSWTLGLSLLVPLLFVLFWSAQTVRDKALASYRLLCRFIKDKPAPSFTKAPPRLPNVQ